MKRNRVTTLLLTALALVAMATGCTTTYNSESARRNYYQRSGSIHNDSFPVDYVPGRYRGYGGYGYGGYGYRGRRW